jgi:organic radical activating enzyme
MSQERIKFVITGGEPTVYKDYLPFVKLLKEEDHIIHTTTNGSNTVKYYSELANYSDIAFSIHLNYVKQFGIDKFINNVQAAAETTEMGYLNDTVAQYNWVIVRIMLDPGNLDIAKQVYNDFKSQMAHYKNFVLAVDLVHDTTEGKELFEYSIEELEWLNSIQ